MKLGKFSQPERSGHDQTDREGVTYFGPFLHILLKNSAALFSTLDASAILKEKLFPTFLRAMLKSRLQALHWVTCRSFAQGAAPSCCDCCALSAASLSSTAANFAVLSWPPSSSRVLSCSVQISLRAKCSSCRAKNFCSHSKIVNSVTDLSQRSEKKVVLEFSHPHSLRCQRVLRIK